MNGLNLPELLHCNELLLNFNGKDLTVGEKLIGGGRLLHEAITYAEIEIGGGIQKRCIQSAMIVVDLHDVVLVEIIGE